MRLSREDFLKADDIVTEEVDLSDIKGYNGSILVRGLTGAERDAWIGGLSRQVGNKVVRNTANATAKLVALCCVDDDGNRLFTDLDVVALGKKSGQALDRVFEVAQRLSGLSDDDVREAEGNSEAIQS